MGELILHASHCRPLTSLSLCAARNKTHGTRVHVHATKPVLLFSMIMISFPPFWLEFIIVVIFMSRRLRKCKRQSQKGKFPLQARIRRRQLLLQRAGHRGPNQQKRMLITIRDVIEHSQVFANLFIPLEPSKALKTSDILKLYIPCSNLHPCMQQKDRAVSIWSNL